MLGRGNQTDRVGIEIFGILSELSILFQLQFFRNVKMPTGFRKASENYCDIFIRELQEFLEISGIYNKHN